MPRIMDFTVEKLGALRILIEDGTTLDVQLIPVRITMADEKLPDGQPIFQVNFQQTVDQRPPEGKLVPEALKKEH